MEEAAPGVRVAEAEAEVGVGIVEEIMAEGMGRTRFRLTSGRNTKQRSTSIWKRT